MSTPTIAATLLRAEQVISVRRVLTDAGITLTHRRARLTGGQERQIVRLYGTGLSMCAVADRLGHSSHTVWRVLHDHGAYRGGAS